jgi:hypothetical protein
MGIWERDIYEEKGILRTVERRVHICRARDDKRKIVNIGII